MQIYTVSRMDGIRCGLVSKLQQTAGMETTTPDGCAALSLHIYLYDQIYVAPKLSRSMPSLNICFSFGLRWRYGSRCGEYKNEGNNYCYCRNLSYDTVVLQFYTKHICSSVEGWGNSGNGLAVYRMGVHGEKLALPFLVFTFQPCIVMHVNSISKCKKTYIFKINHTGLKQNSQKMHVQIVG